MNVADSERMEGQMADLGYVYGSAVARVVRGAADSAVLLLGLLHRTFVSLRVKRGCMPFFTAIVRQEFT